ncbi:MAG: thiamine pyrophosphate-dependent enzyme [Desulfovermiculus sp.]
MAEKKKKLSKVFDYLKYDDPFAGGLTFCAGCPLELLARFVPRVLGDDMVITGTPSCSAPVLLGQNIGSWHRLPYYGTLMTGAAANATGLARMYKRRGIKNTVVCFNGDGTASDIGFGNLSGAAERNEPFIYICYDNEGYMNTGIQRSSTTPVGARTTTSPVGKMTHGKDVTSKNLPLLMAMHKIPYAATATMSYLEDLAQKLLKAKEKKEQGFCYLHVYCPCPTGWGVPTDASLDLCRMAVKTNFFPLWEAEGGEIRFTREIKKPKPISEYTKLIKKFSHLDDEGVARLQKDVDFNYSLLSRLSGKYGQGGLDD